MSIVFKLNKTIMVSIVYKLTKTIMVSIVYKLTKTIRVSIVYKLAKTIRVSIVYKLCLSGDRPQGLVFPQRVYFSILGVLLYQRNEHIGSIGTK